jgi:hypothetical protein
MVELGAAGAQRQKSIGVNFRNVAHERGEGGRTVKAVEIHGLAHGGRALGGRVAAVVAGLRPAHVGGLVRPDLLGSVARGRVKLVDERRRRPGEAGRRRGLAGDDGDGDEREESGKSVGGHCGRVGDYERLCAKETISSRPQSSGAAASSH